MVKNLIAGRTSINSTLAPESNLSPFANGSPGASTLAPLALLRVEEPEVRGSGPGVLSTLFDRKQLQLACTLLLALASFSVALDSPAYGQAGLRASLEQLDTDEDGSIDPDEITPLARPFLERVAKSRRLSLERPNRIDKLQEAARIYFAMQNGVSDDRVRPDTNRSVRSFEPDDDQIMVPEFGLAEVKFPYTMDDLEEADETLERYDRNDDGYMDKNEAARARWTHRDPFNMDLDGDERLSRLELGQRYARRRLLDEDRDELVQRARRVGNGIESSTPQLEEKRKDSAWWRSGGNSFWLTATILARFDQNKNGRLELAESQEIGMPAGEIDINRDSELSREELLRYTKKLQDEVGDTASGIPGWFFEKDSNRDSQVSVAEFSSEWTSEELVQFEGLDLNGDGLLTKQEVIQSKAITGGSYTNSEAVILPPERTVVSEIEVTDDAIIADLDVKVSISHSNVSHLDGYLIGPDGQSIELFTEVGGRDDNFANTIFDDQSDRLITKSRPPFEGRHRPEGVSRGRTGLSHYTGKSLAGTWQLSIRGTRSDRFGMLHQWSLIARPQESAPNVFAASMASPSAAPSTQSNGSAGPPAVRPNPPSSQSGDPSGERPKIDYASIGRKIEDAVKSGKMTREQANQAWISIKSRAKGMKREEDGGDAERERRRRGYYEKMRGRRD